MTVLTRQMRECGRSSEKFMASERKKEGGCAANDDDRQTLSVAMRYWVLGCNCACRTKAQIYRKFASPVDVL